jgi:hypothetical protein
LLAQTFKLAAALLAAAARRERRLFKALTILPEAPPPTDWMSNISRQMSRERALQKSISTWTEASKVWM